MFEYIYQITNCSPKHMFNYSFVFVTAVDINAAQRDLIFDIAAPHVLRSQPDKNAEAPDKSSATASHAPAQLKETRLSVCVLSVCVLHMLLLFAGMFHVYDMCFAPLPPHTHTRRTGWCRPRTPIHLLVRVHAYSPPPNPLLLSLHVTTPMIYWSPSPLVRSPPPP